MFDPEFLIVVEEIRLANDDYIPQLRQILECQNYIMHSSRLVDEDAVNYKCRASGVSDSASYWHSHISGPPARPPAKPIKSMHSDDPDELLCVPRNARKTMDERQQHCPLASHIDLERPKPRFRCRKNAVYGVCDTAIVLLHIGYNPEYFMRLRIKEAKGIDGGETASRVVEDVVFSSRRSSSHRVTERNYLAPVLEVYMAPLYHTSGKTQQRGISWIQDVGLLKNGSDHSHHLKI
ncbi:hypothetical protein DFH08DRAFT_934143 [Mycena albidolilacea]|uniref:Uncharacterized protein n=1 Tax=Mycena albidolilacea TaxID=1033008 RepID=A0AAD7A9T4_9AGAR|nr:hypothetical protein DFH08DRAFT_934143 [Mycena albidolilacea]